MAPTPLHSCSGLLGLRFSHVLLAFWCTFVDSGSALTVIQTPSFVNDSTGQSISFHCSVDNTDYHFSWYRQLPGKSELEVLGYLYTYSTTLEEIPPELKGRLEGKGSKLDNPPRREMRLELSKLQANDTGFYLCAAVNTVKEKGTVAGAKLSIRNKSALYTFLLLSVFYLTSMGNPVLHPSGLIFKTAFGQFMPFGCPELPIFTWAVSRCSSSNSSYGLGFQFKFALLLLSAS
ncbi:uncharacterized protein LOC117667197 [Pantherophis guttatus]|uniref:Uncharacterized protein LOC117667197 n=1 Tax=Pantherophis guttatus TaxID=94885 RepID=A0A6P9BX39_PANGU|nr:uncharacterized protein LOC117667197 [Pantherophis guttatus]